VLRPTWCEFDLDAAAANLATVRRLVGPDRKIFAVLKANAYGCGLLEMAGAFAGAGADALAVADPGEGLRLRAAGFRLPVLVYPGSLPEAAGELLAHDLTPVLTTLEAAAACAAAARGPCPVFVKVDVGLHRLGVPAGDAAKTVRAMLDLPGLRLAGLCTHLHVPAAADPAYLEWQLDRFTGVIAELAADGIDVPVRLAASSDLVLGFPRSHLNAVDPGWMLYGIDRPGRLPGGITLRPVFRSLHTRLIEVKELAPRDRFADAGPFPLTTPVRLGVVPIGASDGLLMLHAGHVLAGGRRVPLLGRPSLEHTRVDLTAVPDARVGDLVTVIGRQGSAEITPADVAAHHGLKPLHVALAIGPRVARTYLPGPGGSG
jgi:alanine racemase